jgi:hypothetical protein
MIDKTVYRAFHNDPTIKEKYISRMEEHIRLDHLVRGMGYERNGNQIRGCAVGCTLNNYDHAQYPIELGIPRWIGHLEDIIFENMSFDKSTTFPLEFLEAINVGSNLNTILPDFMIFILQGTLATFDHDKFPEIFKIVSNIITLWQNDCEDQEVWAAARVAAVYAANVVAYAADTAVDAAADTAAYAARAAAYAVDAVDAVDAASAAVYAADTANVVAEAFDKYADKLIDLIKECK